MTVTDAGQQLPAGDARPAGAGHDRPQASAAVDEVCPYLQADTGTWRSAHPERVHRCAAVEPPVRLAIAKQRSLCLVPAHATCATYLAAAEPGAASPRSARDAGPDLWPATRSVPLVLEPSRSLLSSLPGAGAWTGGQALLVALMVLAFLLLAVARTNAPGTGAPSTAPPASAIVTVSSSPALSSAVPATQRASTPPSVAPSPSSVPTPSPTVAPTTTPSPRPASGTTYKVRAGDTLSSIAARFHTTVKALKAANGITNATLIRPGTVLTIP